MKGCMYYFIYVLHIYKVYFNLLISFFLKIVTNLYKKYSKRVQSYRLHSLTHIFYNIRSKKAIQTNIQIMNTFVQVRYYVLEHKDLTKRFTELEQYFMQYCKDNETDKQKIYEAIDL